MTRKAGQKAEVTRAELLAAAAEEFSRTGFQKASLRTICSNAGVTTGALYFFFKNKEDLLREVLAPVEETLEDLIAALFAIEASYGEDGMPHPAQGDIEQANRAIDALFADRAAVKILVNSHDVPVVCDFVDRVTSKTEEQVTRKLEEFGRQDSRAADGYILSFTAELRLYSVLHVLCHSETKDEALARCDMLVSFVRGGLTVLANEDGGHAVLGTRQ